ncbi:hypothetical protein EPR50_G00192390 [Perca flavescens]|uniref:Metallo-beta-lactamase domain-containing protein n=1 Tax=Perca flavescens TaxID=8167 RepID=A0A484CBD7_PERFV|nr:hypothetical protein EPR50_G00192390 [Perca flavescens]
MAAKRKSDVSVPAEESDQLLIRPLGAGQEVGRSCIILEFKGRKIMLDCGIHPGLEGMDALPYIDLIDPAEIDLLLISHFHLDHCGALPWFLQKTSFKGRTFMTHATKAIYRWLLSDYVKVSNISADDMLYTETDLEESMEKIETINFHEVKEVAGIKFWCYHAGHVLGAAMFMIEIAGVKLLYTGDFSRQEDRHLMAAEIPSVKPDILITSMDHFDDIGPSVVMASPILVHGEQNEMARLKAALIREYEDNDEVDIEVHNPRNTEAVTLNFRGEKLAKVMGSLTDRKCVQGQRVSGILVKRNFNYHIVTPSDLSNYTDLCMSTVTQTQAIPHTGPSRCWSASYAASQETWSRWREQRRSPSGSLRASPWSTRLAWCCWSGSPTLSTTCTQTL